MRTTLAGHAPDRRGNCAVDDAPEAARDNPRRRREPLGDRDDDPQRTNGTTRPPLRHGTEHVRNERRRIVRA